MCDKVPTRLSEGPLFRRSTIPKVRCVRGYNCLRLMDCLGSGGVAGRLGFRVGVSASYRYIISFGKLIHKLRHTSFGIVDLRTSGPESCDNGQIMLRRDKNEWYSFVQNDITSEFGNLATYSKGRQEYMSQFFLQIGASHSSDVNMNKNSRLIDRVQDQNHRTPD